MNLRNRLEYIFFVTFASLVRLLPRSLAIRAGRVLGGLGRCLQPRRVRVARQNLQQAFPEMNEVERDAVIGKMFQHLGVSFVEMVRLDLFSSSRDLDRYFSFEGVEHLHEALKLGRGGIMLSGHVGFWEAGAFFLPQLGLQAAFVAKPMRNPLVDTYINRMRESFGCYQISSRKGARRILKALHSNHLVGILMDQHTRPQEAVEVPFFGRNAYTTPIIAQIAMKHGTPVIPSFVYRTEDGRYLARFEPMIVLEAGDMSAADIQQNTLYLTERIEQGVRREISQWFWIHRRWRDKKPGRLPRDAGREKPKSREQDAPGGDDAE